MRLPTASKIGLATACSFAWSPHAPRWPKYEQSAAADLGNAVHAVAESIMGGDGHPAVVAETAAYVAPIIAAREELLRRVGTLDAAAPYAHVEAPIAFDCVSGRARELPAVAHRDYSAARPTEIVGTADAVLVGQSVIVADWKTGRGARDTRTKDTWQTLFLGLAFARSRGLDTITIALVHLEPGDYWIDWHTLDAFDLDDIEDTIRAMYAELSAAQQTPKPGPHCSSQWCPIRASCPATSATLARVNADAARFLPAVNDITSPEEAARVRVGLKLVDEAAKAWKVKLEEYLRTNGAVPIGDGKYLGIVEQSRDTVAITHEHAESLRKLLGEEIALEAIEVKTSRSAIEEACKARQAKRGDGARQAEQAMQMLRERGAVRTSTFTKIDEFTKKDDAA